MENGIYIGMSRQRSLERRMSMVANNIANMNTPGFKSEHMLFVEKVVAPKPIKEDLSFVMDYGKFRRNSQGPLEYTQNPLDIALEGPGFFAIETEGGTRYSRAGNFKLNNNNELVTAGGLPVLDDGGSRITIPEDARSITIGANGSILTNEGEVARLQIAEFENIHDLKATGGGLYEAGAEPIENATTRAVQGAIEQSNVNGVLEMTDMIEVSRQYQSTARFLQNEHDRLRNAISKLSETQG